MALDAHVATARGLVQTLAPQIGDGLATAILDADQSSEAGIAEQRERVEALRRRLAGLAVAGGAPARNARRLPGEEERVARRRRRLGVRHRLRRPRSRAGEPARRQHPGHGHRGVLEHRRPGVESDAARRRRQVRRRGQAGRQEGSRPAGQHVRARLRGEGRLRRQDGPDGAGVSRSRVLSRARR